MENVDIEDVNEDVSEVIPFATLYSDIPKAAQLINEDADHFLRLNINQKGQMLKGIKRLKPAPEFRDDHKWLVQWMQEEIDEELNGNGPGSVDFVVDQNTGIIVDESPEVIPANTPLTEVAPEGLNVTQIGGVVIDIESNPSVVEGNVVIENNTFTYNVTLEEIAQFCEDQIGEIMAMPTMNNYQNSRRLAYRSVLQMIRVNKEAK